MSALEWSLAALNLINFAIGAGLYGAADRRAKSWKQNHDAMSAAFQRHLESCERAD